MLAIALELYVDVSVEPANALELTSSGEGSDIASGGDHLAARVARSVLGHDRVSIAIRSEIPVGRGLGSSAALAVATAAACGSPDPIEVAAKFDGHAENAAASVKGGLVAACVVDGRVYAESLPLDPALVYAALIPDRALQTETARAVLPEQVPFADAVANLGRMGLLIAGLGDGRRLHEVAGDDHLHQAARESLFAEAGKLLRAMREAGASVTCWSGAGPSLLAICPDEKTAQRVSASGFEAMRAVGLSGRTLVVRADTRGLVTT